MWNYLIMWIVTAVLSALLAPRPKTQDAQPGQIGDKDIPMASADAPIPVLFGTRVLSQPNVVWWGEVQVIAIRKSGGGKK
jgi:hypothetical protein